MAFNTQAQTEINGDRVPVLSGKYASDVSGTEVSPGTDESGSETFGWTMSGQTSGDLLGNVFLSVNYSMSAVHPFASGNSAISIPATVNLVTGGSWSKAIYVDGVYAGTVSGTIVSGTVTWDESHTIATLELQLASEDGTDFFAGTTGAGSFSGTVDRTEVVPTVSGSLRLAY